MPEKVRGTECNESTQTPYAALLLPRLPFILLLLLNVCESLEKASQSDPGKCTVPSLHCPVAVLATERPLARPGKP